MTDADHEMARRIDEIAEPVATQALVAFPAYALMPERPSSK